MGFVDKFSLKNKNAIVTGGSRGLGYSIAQGLRSAGANVVIVGTSDKVIESAKRLSEEVVDAEMTSGGVQPKADYVIGDLSDTKQIHMLYEEALHKLDGTLDILVNCAGIQHRCPAIEFPIEKWEAIIATNLTATFVMSQLAAQTMMEKNNGKIINIASMTSYFGSEMIPAYSASKGGVMQLTKACSNEWSSKGICVNAIAPGYMVTALTQDMKSKNPAQYNEITNRIPMHRWGNGDDLQGTAIFLASAASDYVTGAILPVDGGYLGK